MNAILGARIKSLRESRGFTQEQIAEKMKCTRQKYARLEKGLVDISYANICTIAEALEVKVEEITSVVNIADRKEPMFRMTDGQVAEDAFEYVINMLDTFYAHRKLYNSVRQVDADE